MAEHTPGYITIAADGTLTRHAGAPDARRIEREVGPPGWDQVPMGRDGVQRFAPRQQLRGFVNDCGLLDPETYSRNPVGACVLAALGASGQPYAGTVVITGWDPDSDSSEIRPLTEFDAADIERVHAAVRALLDDEEPSPFGSGWDAQTVAYAEHVRSGATPEMTVVQADSLDELMRKLGGGRG